MYTKLRIMFVILLLCLAPHYASSGLLGAENVCTTGQILKKNAGGVWECASDSTGSGSLGSELASSTNDITTSNASDELVLKSDDESLTIDFDTATANEIGLSSTTSADTLNFGTLDMLTTGSIRGNVAISTYAANQTLTASEVRGSFITVTATATITLPAVDASLIGMSVCVYSTTAAAVNVDANASDRIVLDGTALDDGDKVTSESGAGDFICLLNDANTGWRTLGRSGVWTDGGA